MSSSMGYLLVGIFQRGLEFTWVTSFLFWVSDGMVDSTARGLRRLADVTSTVGGPRRCGYFVQCCLGDFEFLYAILWLEEI